MNKFLSNKAGHQAEAVDQVDRHDLCLVKQKLTKFLKKTYKSRLKKFKCSDLHRKWRWLIPQTMINPGGEGCILAMIAGAQEVQKVV